MPKKMMLELTVLFLPFRFGRRKAILLQMGGLDDASFAPFLCTVAHCYF
jgi:hypothetical protein